MSPCNEMICQHVTLSGYAERPKVADAVLEAQFSWSIIRDCGAGHRARQHQAITVIRRALRQLGLLPV